MPSFWIVRGRAVLYPGTERELVAISRVMDSGEPAVQRWRDLIDDDRLQLNSSVKRFRTEEEAKAWMNRVLQEHPGLKKYEMEVVQRSVPDQPS